MGTKHSFAGDLRASILQAAIQGRLTTREAGDGDARTLLGEIQKEKARLIKEKKIKKQKPLPPIADEEIPFDIPDNWCWVRLGAVCTIARGGSPRPIKEYLTGDPCGINWIKIGDTEKNGKYIYSAKEKIIPEGVEKSRFVHAGDFLLTNSMSYGRPYILKIDGCIHDGWLVIGKKAHIFNEDFLYYFLSSPFVYRQFSEKVSGAVVKNLNTDKVAHCMIPLPPLSEQKRIVEKVDRLMKEVDGLEEAEQALTTLKKEFPGDLRASILQAAIQGRLTYREAGDGDARTLLGEIRKEKEKLIKEKKIKKQKPLPPIADEEIPFDIPDNWCWVRLGDVIHLVSGQDLTPDQYNATGKGIPYITGASNIENGKVAIDRWTEFPKNIAHEKDLLIVCKGTVGKMAYLNVDSAHIARQIMAIQAVDEIKAYVKIYLQAEIEALREQMQGVIPGISRNVILGKVIPIPPLSEQKRIVEKVDRLMKEVDSLRAAGT